MAVRSLSPRREKPIKYQNGGSAQQDRTRRAKYLFKRVEEQKNRQKEAGGEISRHPGRSEAC